MNIASISIIECKVSCPCCKTPVIPNSTAEKGLLINKILSIRADLISLKLTKKSPARDQKISLLLSQLQELNPMDAQKFLEANPIS